MNSPRFAANRIYVQQELLLIDLHRLMMAGGGEAAEADELRDRMEETWWDLTDAERERVGALSGDLYQIAGEEVFDVAEGPDADAAMERIRGALTERNWPELLAALRHRPSDAADRWVAWLRYRAYAELGHWAAAAEFIAYWIRKSAPEVNTLLFEYLYCMDKAGRAIDALREAAQFGARGPEDLYWLIHYAALLLRDRGVLGEGEARRLVDHTVAELRLLLDNPKTSERTSPAAIVYALGTLALLEQARGRFEEAHAACEEALSVQDFDPQVRGLQTELQRQIAPGDDDLAELISPAILAALNGMKPPTSDNYCEPVAA